MPKYYFDTNDHEISFRDDIGTDCDGDDDARVEAMCALADLARQYFPTFGSSQVLEMRVRDESDRPLLEITLNLTLRAPE